MDNSKKTDLYYCNKCNYSTSRNSQFVRHLGTPKHISDKMDKKKVPIEFGCECGKVYLYQSEQCIGLWLISRQFNPFKKIFAIPLT